MQTEYVLAVLMEDRHSKQLVCWSSELPTSLQAVTSTTAAQTALTQENVERVVPEVDRLAQKFPHAVQLVNTDAYASNPAAEELMVDQHPLFTKSHYYCDVHRCYSVQKRQNDLVSFHIMGMIAGAVAAAPAGSTTGLRKALFQVISDRLVLHVGEPPAKFAEYRDHVGHLVFPLPQDLHKELGLPSGRRLAARRFLTRYFLNGDLQNRDQVEHWTLHPDLSREAVLHAMRRWLVPALISNKPPVFARSRWTGSDAAIRWWAVLDLHHGLVLPTLQIWTGQRMPVDQPLDEGWGGLSAHLLSSSVDAADPAPDGDTADAGDNPDPETGATIGNRNQGFPYFLKAPGSSHFRISLYSVDSITDHRSQSSVLPLSQPLV